MKINESNFAFICFHLFCRIEPFQRVTSEKNTKILFVLAPGGILRSLPSPPAWLKAGIEAGDRFLIAWPSAFRKAIVEKSVF
jgi:hypothetical protein